MSCPNTAALSPSTVRRAKANGHYACTDEGLIEALVAMATDRTRGRWEEYRGVLPPVFLDTAEVEHHATALREIVITHVPGLLQTTDYARAVYTYMMPGLPDSELTPRIEHRMRRRCAIGGAEPTPTRRSFTSSRSGFVLPSVPWHRLSYAKFRRRSRTVTRPSSSSPPTRTVSPAPKLRSDSKAPSRGTVTIVTIPVGSFAALIQGLKSTTV